MNERFFVRRTSTRLTFRYKAALLLAMLLIVWMLREALLVSLGRWLRVDSNVGQVDVAIVEGRETVSALAMRAALDYLRQGKATHILITLVPVDESDIFAIPHYDRRLVAVLDSLQVPASAYTVLPLNIADPYTYNISIKLASYCHGQNFTSAAIIHDSFHIRRSYLAYKKQFQKYGIKVFAHSTDIYINERNWWHSVNGIKRVINEYIKLTVYWLRGYI